MPAKYKTRRRISRAVQWISTVNVWPTRTHTSTASLLMFALLVLIAILLFVIAELMLKPYPIPKVIVEHCASAFIVASIIGFSYEYLLNERRERTFRELFEEHREAMFQSLKVYMVLTPEKIFELLRDIVVQTHQIPTLYTPARSKNEFTFADSLEYFNTLIPLRRKEIVRALEPWLHPRSHPHLKFLASDFIGMYKLEELVPHLKSQVSAKLREWNQPAEWEPLDEAEKGWMLNFVWAWSRCEDPMYGKLEDILVTTTDSSIEDWILFVPRQMPDPEFCRVIESYLRQKEVGKDSLKKVILTLAALKQAGVRGTEGILMKFAERFSADELVKEIDRTWRFNGFDPAKILSAIKESRSEHAEMEKHDPV
jgi:hypothetical protein